jgi:seryl-tRNA synthetase
MLDIKFIRENVDIVKEAARQKRVDVDIDLFLQIDAQRRELIKVYDDLRAKQNDASEKIAQAKGKEKSKLIEGMRIIAEQANEAKDKLQRLEQDYRQMHLRIPQIPDPETPIGDESANQVIRTVGEIPQFDFEVKDHIALGKSLDIIDVERGVKLMGTRGYVLKREGAQLEQALAQYALEFLRQRGFIQIAPPVLAQARFLEGTGHFPFAQQETFRVFDQKDREEAKLFLIGTSEVTVCGYHADDLLQAKDLPLKYTALTNCFRTEVGSYGKDTHGLYRVKQFIKVEQVVFMQNDIKASNAMLEDLLKNAEEFIQSLELPYRVLRIATGDMGAGKVKMYDVETYMPSRQRYGETHSASNLGDWQARRLNIKYQEQARKLYCHMLNNTLMASPRLLIPLLEINQQKDGSVLIPQVLRSYMNGMERISRP